MQCGSSSHAGWLEWTVCTPKEEHKKLQFHDLRCSYPYGRVNFEGAGVVCGVCVYVCCASGCMCVCGSVVIACSILQAIKNWRCGRPGNEAMYCMWWV